jgi:serine/threonine protein kinase
MSAHHSALKPGYRLEHYRLNVVLGRGGFGLTYKATDLELGRDVAIKELLPATIAVRKGENTVLADNPALEHNWQWAKERFVEEARILAGFDHPAIVGVHRLLQANGTAYMVMDYVEGESYEARLQRIGTEPDQGSLMAVVVPILEGLAEVHGKGLLHRDIKPENILINRRGQPVLIDFGSAREAVGKTVTMTSIVTHGYSPIEQYQSQGRMGPWTDIYSVAAVMCRALTGEKPPLATDRLMCDTLSALGQSSIGRFSAPFLKAVEQALSVRPDDRPVSVEEWIIRLDSSDGTQPNPAVQDHAKAAKAALGYGFDEPASTGWGVRDIDYGLILLALAIVTLLIGYIVSMGAH